jgi:hypothetical protein
MMICQTENRHFYITRHDSFIADRVETGGKFTLHLGYGQSMGRLRHATSFHHTIEGIGISAVWRGAAASAGARLWKSDHDYYFCLSVFQDPSERTEINNDKAVQKFVSSGFLAECQIIFAKFLVTCEIIPPDSQSPTEVI